MDYTPLAFMGVVVQWSSSVLLLLLFVQMGRLTARRHALRLWTAAWAVQVISISGIALRSVAMLLQHRLPTTAVLVVLDDLYIPGKLCFAALAALGALQAGGRRVRRLTERAVIAFSIVVGVVAVVLDQRMITGIAMLTASIVGFVVLAVFIALRELNNRKQRTPLLALAMLIYGVVTAAYDVDEYFSIGDSPAARALGTITQLSGYGAALILIVLSAAVVLLLVDEAFRSVANARSARMADLMTTESQLNSVIQAARVPIVLTDPNGRVQLANLSAEQQFSLSPRGAEGLLLTDLAVFERSIIPDVAGALAWAGSTAPPSVTVSAVGRGADGTTFPLEITAGPVLGEGRAGFVVIMRDTTAQLAEARERERFEHRMAESEKMLAIGRVVSGVAHELNNPLAVVLGQSEELVSGVLDPEVRDGLQMINEQALRARHIVKDLLMFVRPRDNPQESADIAVLVERVVASQRSTARARGINLMAQLGSRIALVMADRIGIEQVLVNLIDNACDAAGPGGRVRVILRGGELAAELIVEDSGPGVPEEIVDRIFEPFFTTKPTGEATGLGLAVSLGVAQRNGGALRLENRPEPGIGARLVVTLPYAAVEAHPAGTARAPAQRTFTMPGPPQRADGTMGGVLLIDDEAAVRSTLVRIFQRGGWLVQEASSGEEGLARLLDASADALPAVVLCDMKMPGMGGRQVYEQLRARRPDVLERLVFVTGDIVEATAAEFIRTSDTLVVEKPFTVSEIARAVSQVLTRNEGPQRGGPSLPPKAAEPIRRYE